MSPNNRILFKGVFNPKQLNNPSISCFLWILNFCYGILHISTKSLFFLCLSFQSESFYFNSFYFSKFSINFLVFLFQQLYTYKLFKLTVIVVRVKINFSIYLRFCFNIIFVCKLKVFNEMEIYFILLVLVNFC